MVEPALRRVVRADPLAARPLVSVSLLPPATRLVLRGSAEAASACGRAFGPVLPLEACRASTEADRAALWMGPDEWLLVAAEGEAATMVAAIEQGLAATPHALVDVSHRQVGFEVVGAAAALLLNSGCPLDLDLAAFPVDMCTRTVLAKSDVALWRRAPDRFRLEVSRSFSRYVADYLGAALRGL